MSKCIFTGCVLAVSALYSVGHAQTNGWLSVASSSDERVRKEAKTGSFELNTNKGGDEIAVVTGRSLNGPRANPTIALEKWYVRTIDCKRGQGKVVVLTLSGEYKYENDFLREGGTIASGMAEFICDVHAIVLESRNKKGI